MVHTMQDNVEIKDGMIMEKSKVGTSRHRWRRWGQMAMAYLAVAALLTLGALYAVLPDQLYLEPGQELELPRHSWASPLGSRGGQAVASTRAVGSYQTTLALGGWLPIKTVRTVVAQRSRVTVCGTPFGVKMFSEGALVVALRISIPTAVQRTQQKRRACAWGIESSGWMRLLLKTTMP